MNKNKGFTLIELTAVVVLISLIAMLAMIPINKFIKDSRDKLYKKQIEQIILASSNWVVDNPNLLPPYIDETSVRLTIDQLLSEGFLDEDVIDSRNKKKIKTCSYVEITLNTDATDSNKNVYKYNFYEIEEC